MKLHSLVLTFCILWVPSLIFVTVLCWQ